MFDIITIGSATRDIFLKSEGTELRKHRDSPTGIEQCFPLGIKIEIEDIIFTTGGGGTNSAFTFSRQGFKTGCIGIVGDDFNGKEIIEELKKEGVEPFFSIHKDNFTAYSIILVHQNGERTILSYKGEGQHFKPEEIPWDKIKTEWFYLDSLGGNLKMLEKIFEKAKKEKIKIAFNPGGGELALGLEKLKQFLGDVEIFALNKEEGAGLVNADPQNPKEILKNLSQILKRIIILTDGRNGAMVLANSILYSAGVPDSPIVERTGAGDAFNSGFVSEYIRSKDIKRAIQFATANASSVVSYWGAKEGILKKGDWGPWQLVEVNEEKIRT